LLQGEPFNPQGLFGVGVNIPTWLLHRSELSSGEKIAYCLLAKYFNIFSVIESIATSMGVETRQVHRYIVKLEELGLINRIKGGGSRPDSYIFIWNAWIDETTPIDSEQEAAIDNRVNSRKAASVKSLIDPNIKLTPEMIEWFQGLFGHLNVTMDALQHNLTLFARKAGEKGERSANWFLSWQTWAERAANNGWLTTQNETTKYIPVENKQKKRWDKYDVKPD